MATYNLDAANLAAVVKDGVINEDLMQQIWDISRIPLVFSDLLGTGSVSNPYASWVQDRLQAPDITNAVVDGSDSDQNDTNTGKRVGNHCQISTKEVRVSERADASSTVGHGLSYQVMMRQRELRQDVNAILMTNQGSVADDGNSTPGKTAGLPAWLETNIDIPGDATAGGFKSTGLVTAYTPGTKRAITETMLRDMIEAVWLQGGNPEYVLSHPAVIRRISEYMFTSSARIATLQGKTSADSGTGELVAKGSVNVFISDHGNTVTLLPERQYQPYQSLAGSAGDAAWAFILDPDYLQLAYLKGYRVAPLSKTGLSEKRHMAVDYMLKVLNEESQGGIADIDHTAAMTAS